ncbi:MAG: hypothetical protein IPL35_08140 [Sphingobacteriales bacterium]|nr:hypothetical protein [Sphingobacteriales bacterium]
MLHLKNCYPRQDIHRAAPKELLPSAGLYRAPPKELLPSAGLYRAASKKIGLVLFLKIPLKKNVEMRHVCISTSTIIKLKTTIAYQILISLL